MTHIDLILESRNLASLYAFLALVGVVLCLVVMQEIWHDPVSSWDPLPLRWLRRLSLALVALVLLWSVSYLLRKDWQPWPPMLGMVAVLDLWLAVQAAILWVRQVPSQWGPPERRGSRAPGLSRSRR